MASSCGGSHGTPEAQQAAMAQQENAITRSLGKIKHKILENCRKKCFWFFHKGLCWERNSRKICNK